MDDIKDLGHRIGNALARIEAGVEGLDGAGDPGLADELAAEREANAQLEARVRAIKETQETTVASLQDEVAALRTALSDTDADLQRVQAVNADLRASNDALRQANADGLADPDLVNTAMETEIAALRALHDASRSEIDRVLSELEPMIGEAAHA